MKKLKIIFYTHNTSILKKYKKNLKLFTSKVGIQYLLFETKIKYL